jgi:hypothetical protein
MPLVNFTNLDFDQIKSSLREYLRANSNFTDYDFDGSNLSAILELLAYNTYIASYNANMVSNEVFIDGATLRENVVSLARNIGYVPRSKIASKATVSFSIDTRDFNLPTRPVTLTLQKGIAFVSQSSFADNYTFTVPENITVPVVNGVALFENIDIYEGTLLQANFTVDTTQRNQKYILNNANIDTNVLSVMVRDNQQSTVVRKYRIAENLFGVDQNSRIYFIQEVEDQRYELIFGDNVFGKKLENNNYVQVSYLVTNGESANGVNEFDYIGRIVDNNGNVITSGFSDVATNNPAQGGSSIESVASVRKYAPRAYAAQNRAVTAADYEVIIPQIYSDTESVSSFGGEDLDPPQYGKVFVVIKPKTGNYLPNSIKENIKDNIKKYSVAGIVLEILDLKYLYVETFSTVNYNTNLAPGNEFIESVVSENISAYSKSSELNKYGAKFKYSKFLSVIDNSHESITSNITKVEIRRDFRPVLNSFGEYEVCFGNEFQVLNCKGFNVRTSGFNVSGISETVYFTDLPNNDGKTGTIFLFKLNSANTYTLLRKSIGTVDYVKGEIKLNPIKITSTSKFKGENIIEVSAIPKSNDIIGKQDLYLQLDISNSLIVAVPDDISSGNDPAGSNYYRKNSSVLSSYSSGDLVRI